MSIAPATIAIRPPRRSDARAVAEIHANAWREAYLGVLPGPTLDNMIARRGSARWAQTLSQSTGLRVIEFGGRIAGYSSFGPARSRPAGVRSEIYEIYLAPEFQGVGLGRKLFGETRAAAVRAHGGGIVVWALSGNERALDFYAALGGRKGPAASEKLGSDVFEKVSFLWK